MDKGIISLVVSCIAMSVYDATKHFYQWQIKSKMHSFYLSSSFIISSSTFCARIDPIKSHVNLKIWQTLKRVKARSHDPRKTQ